MIALTAPLQLWRGDEGSSHFLKIPQSLSFEIRAHAMACPRGFGSVRVEVRIGDLSWRTSLFPVKAGGYFLPVKIDICRKAGLAAGDLVTVQLELL